MPSRSTSTATGMQYFPEYEVFPVIAGARTAACGARRWAAVWIGARTPSTWRARAAPAAPSTPPSFCWPASIMRVPSPRSPAPSGADGSNAVPTVASQMLLPEGEVPLSRRQRAFIGGRWLAGSLLLSIDTACGACMESCGVQMCARTLECRVVLMCVAGLTRCRLPRRGGAACGGPAAPGTAAAGAAALRAASARATTSRRRRRRRWSPSSSAAASARPPGGQAFQIFRPAAETLMVCDCAAVQGLV